MYFLFTLALNIWQCRERQTRVFLGTSYVPGISEKKEMRKTHTSFVGVIVGNKIVGKIVRKIVGKNIRLIESY